MKKIYRGFEYIDFYCDVVNECTDVEVIVEEIPDTVGKPVLHSVKCTWASANGCQYARKCEAFKSVCENEY